MEKIGIDGRVIPTSGQFKSFDNGGKGSGNFGHAGRPGEVGGSAPAGNGQSKTDPEEKKEIKGGTKAEHEAIMKMVKSYAVDERGIDGVYEDIEAAAHPHEDHTTFQKAKRWLEAGGGEVSYDGAYKTLKDLYGDSFKPETYLTKGGDEENGDWKYKDGQPYVWSTYLYKFAKAIADEMDKRKRGNSLEGVVVNAVIEALNGGKGSGNFGHVGRPGEVGGSAPSGSTSASWRDLPDDAETLEFDSIEKVYLEDRGGWPAYKKKLYDEYSTRYPDKKIVVRRTRMETKGLLEYAVFGLKKDGEQKGKGKSGGQNVSLKGKSLYEKVHMIEPGDEVHIKPSSKVPNFPKEIKVDYVEDGTIHYGSSETSDGYTYPAWAIDDIKKIIRKK